MQEEDIRPFKLKNKSDRLFKIDARNLLKEKSKFICNNCPGCNSSNYRFYFNKLGYIFNICKICNTIFISPRPTSKLLDQYYANAEYYKYWMKNIFPITRQARINNIYKPRIKLIIDFIKKNKITSNILVDIGAGSGDFGIEINKKNLFKQIMLIEPGKISIKFRKRIKIFYSSFENIRLPTNVNVYTCFEVIEHLFCPRDLVMEVYKTLRSNGLFIFSTVNHLGFDIQMLGKKSEYLIGPDHLNIFTPDSIKNLLQKVGFKKIQITTPGKLDIDLIITAHKNKIINLRNFPFLYYLFMNKKKNYIKEFQKFLQDNNLSSHMLVIAQK